MPEVKVLAKNGMKIYLKKDAVKLMKLLLSQGLTKRALSSTNSLTLFKESEIRNTGATIYSIWLTGFLILTGQEEQVDQGIFKLEE